jgi:DNA repair exonuclease SbcCD nuclease subunit
MSNIQLYNKNIAIISDLHMGLHSNSELWHGIILKYGEWLKKELMDQKISDLLILGDIFNNREEIGVKTLHVTEQFFKIFSGSEYPFNIILLNGNHDSYFRDNSEVNSISIFKGWSNVHVIDTVQTIEHRNKKLTFIPWGLHTNIPTENDVLFGHFEINTFKKTVASVCEHGIDSSVLLEKSKLIMSGHFHLRDERDYKNGKIVYVGCPFQQNWNDVNSTKGYYILDVDNLQYQFYPNNHTPKHIAVNVSDFLDKNKQADIKTKVSNNFIKIIADVEVTYEQFEKILSIISLMKPLEVTNTYNNDKQMTVKDNYEVVHLDVKELLKEFVEQLDIKDIKDKILKELTDIHDIATNRVKIEEA